MDERLERVGRNQALFRQVNDKIRELNEDFGAVGARMSLVCECGDRSCGDQIELTPDEYLELRRDPTIFGVRPGHQIPEGEDVVDRRESYWLVRKHPDGPARLAEALDGR